MSKVKKQKKTPLKIEYDGKHPPRVFRSDHDLEEIIQATQKDEGLSRSDAIKYLIRIGAGKLEVRQRSEKEIREKSYQEGYMKAKAIYSVQFKCAGCKETIAVESEDVRKAAAKYLQEHGWGHSECAQGKAGNKMSVNLLDLLELLDNKGI